MRYEEYEADSTVEPEEEREIDLQKDHKCHVSPIKINCDFEITVESKNKIIYVCPGKLQYFTASAICCSDDKTIEIEYCGHNTKCICGEAVICGCLGYYKIVKSGIIFIPSHKLSEFRKDSFPIDILCFKVKDKDDRDHRDVKFDVVFTYYRSTDCEHDCNKKRKC